LDIWNVAEPLITLTNHEMTKCLAE
jgi:hypothetical protein